MKQIKILTVLFFLLIAASSFAQDLKGKWIVGTKVLSMSSSSGQFNLSFNPSLGIYISNKTGIGGMIEYSYVKPKNVEALVNWSAGPFFKYYFLKLSEKDFFYTRERLLFGQAESYEYTGGRKVIYANTLTEGVSVGFTTSLNPRLWIEFEPGVAFTQKSNVTLANLTFDIRFEYRFGAD